MFQIEIKFRQTLLFCSISHFYPKKKHEKQYMETKKT